MSTFFWIVVGLVLGWLIEWIIDWFFWRKSSEDPTRSHAEITKLQTELGDVRTGYSDAQNTIADLRAQLNKVLSEMPKAEDKLERVKGIGAVFAGKLKKAGVNTFEDLSNLTPEQVEAIIQPEEWQKIEAEEWITEAAAFAAQKLNAKA